MFAQRHRHTYSWHFGTRLLVASLTVALGPLPARSVGLSLMRSFGLMGGASRALGALSAAVAKLAGPASGVR